MNAELRPDLCILGGGAGGVALALGAAASGLSVVLVEQAALGGSRLTQAVPRNALIAASRAAGLAQGMVDFRAAAPGAPLDFARARKHIAFAVAAMAPNYAQARLEAMNVKVMRAAARFTGRDSCAAGGHKIAARRFVVATGAVEKTLPIPGLDLVRPLDAASLCALDRPPQNLIVLGADPDGLALAQALRRFGCGVTVLAPSKVFPHDDEELTAPVRAGFERDGMVIHEGVRISRIEPGGEGVRIFTAGGGHEKPLTGSHILIAAGRAPVVEGLGLAEAGVRYNETGIETGTGLATSNRRIHAIGAVVRGAQQDGLAEQHAGVVLRIFCGLPGGRGPSETAPRVIWTCPPFAVAGLSETQARARYRHIHVLRWPFSEIERAHIEHQPGGHIKLIADRRGKLLGAGIVGAGAGDVINLCGLAISKSMTASDFASIMVFFPAFADAVRRAAMTFPANRLGYSLTQQVRRFLRWFA